MARASAGAASSLLSPTNHVLLLVDHQSQMAFATQSIDHVALRNNVALVAKGGAGFGVASVITTVAAKSFSGPLFPEVTQAFPAAKVLDRTNMNPWEDVHVVDAINATGKDRVVIGGLWTSVCIVDPVLTALEQGFKVHVLADACGDVSVEAHNRAMDRMFQAGAIPMTSVQYLLELQRDWARAETYELTTGIAKVHAGGYGLGIQYAYSMFGGAEGNH